MLRHFMCHDLALIYETDLSDNKGDDILSAVIQ